MKIVFLDEYSVGGADIASIAALGDYLGYEFTSPDQVVERCAGAEVVITNKCLITRDVMAQLPALRLICVAATGVNNIDLDAAEERGVEVRNAVGYSTYSVAEATLGAALSLHRQISYFDRFVKGGAYSSTDRLFCFDRPIGQLRGSRWGIIGLGAIGREVARLAQAFGCEVRYFSASGASREESIERVESLAELLGWGDVISIHSPLNEQTKGLIGADEITAMRPTSLLINVARGGIVDESALASALDRGTIGGAAFDVFAVEPLPASSPLLSIADPDKLRLSPHNAWASEASVGRLIEAIAQNISNFYNAR